MRLHVCAMQLYKRVKSAIYTIKSTSSLSSEQVLWSVNDVLPRFPLRNINDTC